MYENWKCTKTENVRHFTPFGPISFLPLNLSRNPNHNHLKPVPKYNREPSTNSSLYFFVFEMACFQRFFGSRTFTATPICVYVLPVLKVALWLAMLEQFSWLAVTVTVYC